MADDEEDEKPKGKGEADAEGGEGGEGGESGGGGGRSFSPIKILLFVGLPVLLLLGGGLTAYLMGWLSFFGGHGGEPVAEAPAPKVEPAAFIDLPRMTVNLATTGNQRALLQLTMSIEVAKADQKAAVEAALPRVIDAFQVFLRDLRVEDLAGTRGTYRLKEEMLTRANAAVAPLRVQDVLFREMLVQ